MDPLIASGLITGASSGLANIGNFFSQIFTNRSNYNLAKDTAQWNRQNAIDLANLEYQHNLEAWHMQNDYNSPSSQMKRLKDAGLNPNLAYGSLSAGQAGSMPSYNVDNVTMGTPHFDTPRINPTDVLSMYNSVRMTNAQIDQIEAQTARTKNQMTNDIINQMLGRTQIRGGEIANELAAALLPYQLEAAELNNQQSAEMIKNIMARTGLTELQAKKLVEDTIISHAEGIISSTKANYWSQGVNPDKSWIERVFHDFAIALGATGSISENVADSLDFDNLLDHLDSVGWKEARNPLLTLIKWILSKKR